ncbi:MAG: ABC transporter substrate-binding protein, partial [Kiritimatiellae bacterium]|nr:ABC transporter substrate-binding protein [Kiritimatiellia bacterium]
MALFCTALIGLGSALSARAQELEPLRFMPHWVPQAQFAGFYMAQQKGFYIDQGLAVEIQAGGPGRDPMQLLAEGGLDVCTTFLSTALKARADGAPVVNIGQIVQRSALLLVTRASSGIQSPADLDGRVVTIWPFFDLQPRALFKKFNVKPVLIPQLYSFNLFLRGGADV